MCSVLFVVVDFDYFEYLLCFENVSFYWVVVDDYVFGGFELFVFDLV